MGSEEPVEAADPDCRHQRIDHAVLRHQAPRRPRQLQQLSLDALTGIVYEDDSQIAELHLKRAYDKARPKIEIEVDKTT